VDTEKIGAELLANLQEVNVLIKGANKVVSKPELQETVDELRESLHAFKNILRKLDQRIEPIVANLEMAIGSGHQALEKTQVTLDLVNDVLSPESPLQYRFIELSEELAETARSIRSLVDLLEREPNSIIFDKGSSGEK
jgi:paraquat-inducible protein B